MVCGWRLHDHAQQMNMDTCCLSLLLTLNSVCLSNVAFHTGRQTGRRSDVESLCIISIVDVICHTPSCLSLTFHFPILKIAFSISSLQSKHVPFFPSHLIQTIHSPLQNKPLSPRKNMLSTTLFRRSLLSATTTTTNSQMLRPKHDPPNCDLTDSKSFPTLPLVSRNV